MANGENSSDFTGFISLLIFLYQIVMLVLSVGFQVIWFFVVLIALVFKKKLKVFAPIIWAWRKITKAQAYDDELNDRED